MRNNTSLKICQKCGGLCCKTLGGPNVTKNEMQKVVNAGHPNFFIKHSNTHYEIKSKKGTCLYLSKENLCSIHEVRPLVCRWWPVDYTYRDGKIELFLIECPLTKYVSEKYIQLMKRQITQLPEKTIHDFYSSTYLHKSEIKLIKKGKNRFKRKKL